jgi:hypothetical protein
MGQAIMRVMCVVISSMLIFLLANCTAEVVDEGRDEMQEQIILPDEGYKIPERGPFLGFDRENTFTVIQETLESYGNLSTEDSDSFTRQIMGCLYIADVHGVVTIEIAEWHEDGHMMTLEIKSEDDGIYHIHVSKFEDDDYVVEGISDMILNQIICIFYF